MNTLYFGSKSKLRSIFCFSTLFILSVFSCIGSMDNVSNLGYFLDNRAEILQNVLCKKRPFVVNKQPCVSEKKSYGTAISLQNVEEIEYLSDHRVAIRMNGKKYFMIDLHSNERWAFSKPFMKFNCTMPMSKNTETVIHWGEDGCANMKILESFSYDKKYNYKFNYQSLFLPVYCDENQLPLIWVKKNEYDYVQIGDRYSFCSDVKIYESVLDSSLNPNGIISQCKEKFTTYYDSNKLFFNNIYCAPPHEILSLYSRGKQFIIQCISKEDDICCSILYLGKENIPNASSSKELSAIPCSMVLHPVRKGVFALMLAEDRTIQYWGYRGNLIAEQKRSNPHVDNVKQELSFFDRYLLSFSPDGSRLAAVFPEEIVFFDVPLRIQVKPRKLRFILFCLKDIVPKDIVGVFFNIFRSR